MYHSSLRIHHYAFIIHHSSLSIHHSSLKKFFITHLSFIMSITAVFGQYTQSYYTETLPSGTSVMLELNESLHSHELSVGDPVKLTVSMNVTVQGTVLIRYHAAALGKVTRVTAPTYNYPATVEIKATQVQTVDDRMIPLNGTPLLCKGIMPGETFTVSPGKTLEAYVLQNEIVRSIMPRR
jgi:hypothetical protein